MKTRGFAHLRSGIALALTLCAAVTAVAQWDGPDVYNVRAYQRAGTNLVDIHYDMITVEWEPASVSAYLSIDGGQTYTVPCVTVSGDVGAGVQPGVGRSIVWDAGVDYPAYSGDDCRIRVTANSGEDGGVFVLIPGGAFRMGEGVGHWVHVEDFYVSRIEVTSAQYEALMGTATAPEPRWPALGISWYNAIRYCNALSASEGLTPCYDETDWSWDRSANGYRLLTESEWEYACRAGSQTTYCNGNSEADLDSVGWYDGNSGNRQHDVMTKAPNLWGIHDMHGNILEWCWDWWGPYPGGTQENPHIDVGGPATGSVRILRGGDYDDEALGCRSGARYSHAPAGWNYNMGFRVARTAD